MEKTLEEEAVEVMDRAINALHAMTRERNQLKEKLQEAENALWAAMEDCHPTVEAYFDKYPRKV
jgi:hypothetical protein